MNPLTQFIMESPHNFHYGTPNIVHNGIPARFEIDPVTKSIMEPQTVSRINSNNVQMNPLTVHNGTPVRFIKDSLTKTMIEPQTTPKVNPITMYKMNPVHNGTPSKGL